MPEQKQPNPSSKNMRSLGSSGRVQSVPGKVKRIQTDKAPEVIDFSKHHLSKRTLGIEGPRAAIGVFKLSKFDRRPLTSYKVTMFSEIAGRLKAEFDQKVVDRTKLLKAGGCSHEMALAVAGYNCFTDAISHCRSHWAQIPSYKAAKDRLESRDPAEHYDEYWRPFAEVGFLYQPQIKEYDPHLIGALNGYVRRRSNKELADRYQIPTLKDYNTRLAGYVNSMFGREIARVIRTVDSRPLEM